MWRHLRFVLSNNFAVSASEEKFILKNISKKEESEEVDEFHDSQKCLRQSSGKKLSTKKKCKIEPLNLKKIQNPWKICFENFLIELWPKHFWESWNSSVSSDSSFAEIFFKNNFLSRSQNSKIIWKYKTQMPSHTL